MRSIIEKYRSSLIAAGLLKPAGTNPVSSQVKVLRPSLGKINAALIDNPHRFDLVQPTPFSILFDVTLPKLEAMLLELGEERAEAVINRLCEHGQAMIKKHGLAGSQAMLTKLFADLPKFEYAIRDSDADILKILLEIYSPDSGWSAAVHSNMAVELAAKYIRLSLGDKISALNINDDGLIDLGLKPAANDADLSIIKKVAGNLRALNLYQTGITDQGLSCLANAVNLIALELSKTAITDNGLAYLRGSVSLQDLRLTSTGITSQSFKVIKGFAELNKLLIHDTKTSDEGIEDLAGLKKLQKLGYSLTDISQAAFERLQQEIPGLQVA